jgi:general secretion pathway protein C
MDVAKRLADWRDRREHWLAGANRHLAPAVAAALVIVIANQFATLTWVLVPGSTSFAAPVLWPVAARPAPADFSSLSGSRLFGEAAEQPHVAVAAVADAPDTTLSVTLTGILSKDGDPNGSAGIRSGSNDERAYYVGQTIAGTDGATLHSVYADRVLLDRNGRVETLRLPTELSPPGNAPPNARSPLAQEEASAAPLRDVFRQNAATFSEIIRPAPHVQEGQLVGIRLMPGRDRATFEALGFQSGDVVTDVNGSVLDDISQALKIFEALGQSTQANVTVLRDGVPQVLVIDAAQLQGLPANRE